MTQFTLLPFRAVRLARAHVLFVRLKRMRNPARNLLHTLFGIYAWLALVGVAGPALALMLVLPGLDRRRRLARSTARAFFKLARIGLGAHDMGRLPTGACIVVANHSSYLDGVILTAVLPANFSFVIKREIQRVPLVSILLRRIGSEFVERSDGNRGARDARRLLRAAAGGRALAFFPEGTFQRQPGLLRFRSGAFAAAARYGLPVVPVVIRGARQVLPAKAWLMRPGRLEVSVQSPIGLADPGDSPAPAALRAAARSSILAVLDEPDLAPVPVGNEKGPPQDGPCRFGS